MNNKSLIALVPLIISVVAGATNEMVVGDGRIDGRKIKPFEITWHQCALVDGHWKYGGIVTETLTPIGDAVLRLRRNTRQSNGMTAVSTTYFDRVSFAPVRMESDITAADGGRLAYSQSDLSTDGYTGNSVRGGEERNLEGKITSNMLAGSSLGLPLATLAYQSEPLEFLASMMSFDASYRVIAEWVGRETLSHEGKQVEAWLVDVEWHHKKLADVYPAGPDASGGRYWVVADPPDGFPYVPRYKTDTYAVEFIQSACPKDAK